MATQLLEIVQIGPPGCFLRRPEKAPLVQGLLGAAVDFAHLVLRSNSFGPFHQPRIGVLICCSITSHMDVAELLEEQEEEEEEEE